MRVVDGRVGICGGRNYSDIYYDWCGRVIKAVLAKHPDKWFGCLVYNNTYDPPREAKVHPRLVPYICMDRMQWETILRSVSAHRSFRWAEGADYTAANIANFLILDRRMPRSLAFCASQMVNNLTYLTEEYGEESESLAKAKAMQSRLKGRDIGSIFEEGLHEFLGSVMADAAALGRQIEQDYRFIK